MLNSRMEMTEERVSEFEERSIEIIQYEPQQEEVNKTSGACGLILKGLTFMLLKSQKKRRNSVMQKKKT